MRTCSATWSSRRKTLWSPWIHLTEEIIPAQNGQTMCIQHSTCLNLPRAPRYNHIPASSKVVTRFRQKKIPINPSQWWGLRILKGEGEVSVMMVKSSLLLQMTTPCQCKGLKTGKATGIEIKAGARDISSTRRLSHRPGRPGRQDPRDRNWSNSSQPSIMSNGSPLTMRPSYHSRGGSSWAVSLSSITPCSSDPPAPEEIDLTRPQAWSLGNPWILDWAITEAVTQDC